ncbi:DUF3006 domain-containing protein [Domibacillus aminovorans]|uniref:DUF3006 family protein n=1 Tax=Domibacillus aminovorans TaxID=29332 RepID=UPI003D210E5A
MHDVFSFTQGIDEEPTQERNGIYTIDSIEKDKAKLFWRDDESIEELIEVEKLRSNVKEGDLLRIEFFSDGIKVEILKEETESIKERARAIKEQLLKRKQ